jgi:hypothetical protein
MSEGRPKRNDKVSRRLLAQSLELGRIFYSNRLQPLEKSRFGKINASKRQLFY